MLENKYSYKTAIRRNRLSLPCRWLLAHNLINGRVLDYGCGYGDDVAGLRYYGYDCTGFDPYYHPFPPLGDFDTLLCTYVLNVLFEHERQQVLDNLRFFMDEETQCYIAVRRDFPTETQFMHHSSLGTYQFYVKLDLPIIIDNSKFCIYQLTK